MKSNYPSLPSSRLAALALGSLGAVVQLVHSADYPSTVLADAPAIYYRLGDAPNSGISRNAGTAGPSGNATNLNLRAVGGGAIVGDLNSAAYFNGSGARAIIPFQADLNPPATDSFTVEAWVNPSVEVTDSPGPAPLMNRYSYSGANRQGWVFFQRSPATGWNFRTYTGVGSATGINITGQAATPDAGKAGTWTHLAAVWDGKGSIARLFVNGEQVAKATGTYLANTDDHPEEEAVRGAAGISLGSYNNTEPGSNPFRGKVDEFALYGRALTEEELRSHYQNGTNANRTVPYRALVQSHEPRAYLRLDEPAFETDLAVNLGSAGGAGDGLNGAGVLHPAPGATDGRFDSANAYRPKGSGGGTTTLVPWTDKLNPEAASSFTIESWFYVAQEVTDAPGPAPLMNRYSYSGANRQGWVYFQRSPTSGWNFRTYTGVGSATGVNITGQASTTNAGTAGTWNHVVTVWDGPNTQATLFVNGEQVAQGTGDYAANTDDHDPAEAVRGAAGLGIGSYNNTQPGENPFTGRVDEVAFYAEMLSAERILAHYRSGTNSNRSLVYEAEVLADLPVEFLRMDEPAFQPAANAGAAGTQGAGAVVYPRLNATGPSGPGFPGFEPANPALGLDGTNSFLNLGNPLGPVIVSSVTLEAWIQPATVQGPLANVLAATPSIGDEDSTFLRINGGTHYELGTAVPGETETTVRSVKVAIPDGDLSGTRWTHLVGTYDRATWRLYRNGVLVGSETDTNGLPVSGSFDWAVGGRGDGIGRSFAGSVDEVAVYPVALSATQIQAHYTAATTSVAVAEPLTLQRDGAGIRVTWKGAGVLQSSAQLTGTYVDVPGAASPAVLAASAAEQYFRLRK